MTARLGFGLAQLKPRLWPKKARETIITTTASENMLTGALLVVYLTCSICKTLILNFE